MGDLSAHFDSSEFRDHQDGTLIPPDPRLIAVLENLRGQLANEPLEVLSGYRSPEHNAAVGGAPDSQHLYSRAADLTWGRITVEQAAAAGATGIGYCDGYVTHIDVRPGEPVTFVDC